MVGTTFDINCDLGEANDDEALAVELQLVPIVSRCNISCGAHAGDPERIRKVIQAAVANGKLIGAHPSYPDRDGFGRDHLPMPADELKRSISQQIAWLTHQVEAAGGLVSYVKPHGALYNRMLEDPQESAVICETIQSIDSELALMTMPGSAAEAHANRLGLPIIREGFADRSYATQSTLRMRGEDDAVLTDPEKVLVQLRSIMVLNIVSARDGDHPILVDTCCVHGDNPNALAILRHLSQNVSIR